MLSLVRLKVREALRILTCLSWWVRRRLEHQPCTRRHLDRERHGRVDYDQLISLKQEDPAVRGIADKEKILEEKRGNKTAPCKKIQGIVYRRFEDPGINISLKEVFLTKLLRRYVMSVAHGSNAGSHLGIRRPKGEDP
ncbi:hypothetical protein PoB_001560200 [Plakobranchus ocellatus]|uniref:Uncharacterized protein n=1 Tax=Plakobranchus ocellatus TaxID=259542 RepID=A0AAV3Z3G9_9GAST|nr:hypothetical protein PoB_001560200 [Plakobranchus ocellatus]